MAVYVGIPVVTAAILTTDIGMWTSRRTTPPTALRARWSRRHDAATEDGGILLVVISNGLLTVALVLGLFVLLFLWNTGPPQLVRTGEWCTVNEHYPYGVCLGTFEWSDQR